jgi:hypothetical protein
MAITFGQATAPSNITTYLDSVFATSLANYSKQLVDNIGASNAILYEILHSDAYQAADGGTYLAENLIYALSGFDSYDGYDTLSTMPTDGVTQALYEWRQAASPITYSMKEVIQNKHKLNDLVKTRISQSEMGIQEGWAQAFMWGNAPFGGKLTDPRASTVNGSLNVNPLAYLISYNTAGTDEFAGTASSGTALTVGNIAESTSTWWQNHWATSTATTYTAFVFELEKMYNSCALGTGGPPSLILVDQMTYQLYVHAYFSIYHANPDAVGNEYPFEAKKFFKAKIVMDDKVADVYTGTSPTPVGGVVKQSSLTYGTAYFVNGKFFKIRYAPERDFELLKDENGKGFVKPIGGDSRVGNIGWMGNTTIANRRKHGVLAKIARSLTA